MTADPAAKPPAEQRCAKCDRAECDRMAASFAWQRNTPGSLERLSAAHDDCAQHAVDWRVRALKAEAIATWLEDEVIGLGGETPWCGTAGSCRRRTSGWTRPRRSSMRSTGSLTSSGCGISPLTILLHDRIRDHLDGKP